MPCVGRIRRTFATICDYRLPLPSSAVLSLMMLLSAAIAAEAEPVTLRYHVTVTHRADLQSRVPVAIARIEFSMAATFDSGITNRSVTYYDDGPGGEISTDFGVPQFTGVPLLPGLGPSGYVSGQSEERRFGDPNGSVWTLSSATLQANHYSLEDSISRGTYTALFATSERTVRGDPTADSFLSLLRRPRFQHTSFAYDFSTESYLPGSFIYSGFATPLGVAEVPEPGTFALLIIGVATAAGRWGAARQRKRGSE